MRARRLVWHVGAGADGRVVAVARRLAFGRRSCSLVPMAAHMGMFEVKGHVLRVHGQFLRPLVRIQVWARFDDLIACCTRSSSHSVAACCGCTNIPPTAGGAQEAGTILSVGC